MFGAFLCEPVNPEADFGVLFMDTGGYLNMCGHCTIGAVTVALEAGLKESHEGENEVVLEAPAGLIRTTALVKDGKVEHVTLTNVPAFVYKENISVTIDGKEIHNGDIMGINDGGIAAVGKDLMETTIELLSTMVDEDSELICLYYGADVSKQDADALSDEIEEKFPECEVEVNFGGQPIYYYMISVE